METATHGTDRAGVSARDLTVPWWVVAVPAVLFIVLGIVSRGGNTLAIDLRVSRWVQGRSVEWADPLAWFGNTIGEAPVGITLLVVAVVGSIVLKRWRELWFLVVVAAGRLLATRLKAIFESPRPNDAQVHLDRVFDGYGFPSGHTLTATLAAGAIIFLLGCEFPDRRVRLGLLVTWAVAITCTAFARIWVGAHWFTDTLGGALVGITIVLLAANLSVTLARATRSARPPASDNHPA